MDSNRNPASNSTLLFEKAIILIEKANCCAVYHLQLLLLTSVPKFEWIGLKLFGLK